MALSRGPQNELIARRAPPPPPTLDDWEALVSANPVLEGLRPTGAMQGYADFPAVMSEVCACVFLCVGECVDVCVDV